MGGKMTNMINNINNSNENVTNELFETLIFNEGFYNELIEDIGNDEFENEIQDIKNGKNLNDYFENKFGFQYNSQSGDQLKMKNLEFIYFNQVLCNKLGIIFLFSDDKKSSFNRLKILLNKLTQITKKDLNSQELIKQNCSIFLLDKTYEHFQYIKSYANFNENDLPSILFVKKDFKEQELDGDCIKYITSNFEDIDLFFDTLINMINIYNKEININN
jgi:hypothetical protein